MRYRPGLDIGTNSIGWVMYALGADDRPDRLIDGGVRIFTDGRNPRDRTSLATGRRLARSMRRNRDRYLQRRDRLLRALVRHGLMPQHRQDRKRLEQRDPWTLRARGLDAALSPFEFGRAIFHLAQRRGFRSNRRVDRADDDAGKVRQASEKLVQAIKDSGSRTLGEYLAQRRDEGQGVRARLSGQGAKAAYDLYPTRRMLCKEFVKLWRVQRTYHPTLLIDDVKREIAGIIFDQRPLKPVRPGKCTLDPTEERAPRALPLAQRVRIYQEVNNMRVALPGEAERPLTLAERDSLTAALLKSPKVTFERMRLRILKLPVDARFNLESSEKRKDLKGDEVAAVLAHKDRWGKAWRDLPLADQSAVAERLLAEEDEGALMAWLTEHWHLSPEATRAVADARLPDGYGRLGRTALARLYGALHAHVVTYDQAVVAAGYHHHSDFRTGEVFDAMPYYGEVLERYVGLATGEPKDLPEVRYGRIANPTVHIGLNQLRRVVNALIARYGPPSEVHIELARALKQNEEQRRDADRQQADNQRRNDRHAEVLASLGQANNGANRLRLRLWEELNADDVLERCCVYTGEVISIAILFSEQVEIEHILPVSQTLDDSGANKTISLRRANRDKGQRSPFDAFGHSPLGYDWQDIAARAAKLPGNKRRRFQPDAMARYAAEGGFLARHLTDTQYLARVCKTYLHTVCDPNRVVSIPGRLTAMLRGKWGLNALLSDHNLKERVDHRHHLIDAAVVAATDRSLLNRVSRAAGRAEAEQLERAFAEIPHPWPEFRDELDATLRRVTVSHRADRGTGGRLHEDSAYGPIANPADWGGHTIVFRKGFVELNENEIGRIRDADLREAVEAFVAERKAELSVEKLTPARLREALHGFAALQPSNTPFQGLRRVRIMKVENVEAMVGPKSDGAPYKLYPAGEIHHIDIYDTGDGRWRGEGVSLFHVNQPEFRPRWHQDHPAARLVMRLHKNDLIAIDRGQGREVMVVKILDQANNRVRLALHRESGKLQERHDDRNDPFRWLLASYSTLQSMQARTVTIDPIGRIRRRR